MMKNLTTRGVYDQEGEDGKSFSSSATQKDEVRVTSPFLKGEPRGGSRNDEDAVSFYALFSLLLYSDTSKLFSSLLMHI